MARPLRIEFSGALNHATSRGDSREDIYLHDADCAMFLGVLDNRDRSRIVAYNSRPGPYSLNYSSYSDIPSHVIISFFKPQRKE